MRAHRRLAGNRVFGSGVKLSPQIPFPANVYVRVPVSGDWQRTDNPRGFETALRDFLEG